MRKAICTVAALFTLLLSAHALAPSAGAGGGGFSVSPVMPENQNPDTQGYYDLWVTPGYRQEIAITVVNTSDEDITVLIQPLTATTNRNGIIDYADPGRSDETLRFSFGEMARLENETLTIPAGAAADVPITFTVPDESFDGIILGSIAVLREPTEEERAAAGMILNQHRYVVAVRIQMNDKELEPDFLLGDISATLTEYRASIIADIRNPMPRITRDVAAHAQIYPLGSGEPIFELSYPKVAFAPNTVFPFTLVDNAGFGLQAGDYLAKIQLEYEDRVWEFEKEFEIRPEEAEEINSGAANLQQPPSNQQQPQQQGDVTGPLVGDRTLLIALGGAALLLVILVIVLISKSNAKRIKQLESMLADRKDQDNS